MQDSHFDLGWVRVLSYLKGLHVDYREEIEVVIEGEQFITKRAAGYATNQRRLKVKHTWQTVHA